MGRGALRGRDELVGRRGALVRIPQGGRGKKVRCPEVSLAMALALRLGCTLEQLGQRMSAQEFSLWLALYEQSPWDDSRLDLGFGVIAATVANYAGKMRAQSAPAASPLDFMPFVKRDEIEEEPDAFEHFGKFK